MIEELLSYTSLPNLHPAVVHFPIALWTVAVAADLLSLARPRWAWIERTAISLYTLGALGAGAAYLAGEQAEESLRFVPPAAQAAIARHADLALWTLWTFALVAAGRLAFALRSRGRDRSTPAPVRIPLLLGAAAGLWLVLLTADRGGALVYQHGVSVAAVAGVQGEAGASLKGPSESLGSAGRGLERTVDGGLVWTPAPGDTSALGTVLAPVEGSRQSASVAAVAAPGQAGLELRVAGRAILVLPGAFGDVQVEARLDLGEFRGAAGLAHHVTSPESAGIFQVDTAGEAKLVDLAPTRVQVLDRRSIRLPPAPVTVAVSVAGSHLKGMVDGAMVVHGHREPGDPGAAGLFVEGSGAVRVFQMRVMPLASP